mmetsp:Transcript_33558/g.51605  ORF Transcript_33558/g.51605 Transcript_33558/m.51605 type:complete len:144 (+) Transcript_33558:1348-1779(+)
MLAEQQEKQAAANSVKGLTDTILQVKAALEQGSGEELLFEREKKVFFENPGLYVICEGTQKTVKNLVSSGRLREDWLVEDEEEPSANSLPLFQFEELLSLTEFLDLEIQNVKIIQKNLEDLRHKQPPLSLLGAILDHSVNVAD